jgi:two-component system, NtrC family, C4-dicarboxylate transport sensor histidine kinase DctB
MSAVGEAYERWAARQDEAVYRTGVTVSSWVTTGIVIYLLAGGAYAAGQLPREHLLRALLAPVPIITEGILVAILYGRGIISWRTTLAFCAAGTGLLVFAFAALMSLTRLPYAWLFSAMVLFVVGFHSWLTKASPRAPVTTVSGVIGLLAGIAVNPSMELLENFGVTIVFTIYLGLFIGRWAESTDATRQTIDAYRSALQAQVLADKTRQIGTLRHSLTRVMGARHDQRNLVQALALNVSGLADVIETDDARAVVRDLEHVIARLCELSAPEASEAVADDAPLEPTSAKAVVDEVVKVARAKYPSVVISARVAELSVLVRGGATNLHRVLLNLVLNACEGDGKRVATEVEISVERSLTGSIGALVVRDNGPGFSEKLLESRTVLESTKPAGSGLGLFTVEALVEASDGRIEFTNGPTGGAVVKIELVLEGEWAAA